MESTALSEGSEPLSARGLRWRDRCDDEARVTALQQQASLDVLTARLLAGRGIEPEDADIFLAPSLRAQLPDPSTLQDMDKAVALILDAIQAKKSITVFADYDVDGGTSAAQLTRWARSFGAEFGLYVPDRVEEGYGPSVEAFEALKSDGIDLVITVDCGAAAHAALEAAQGLDLPIIVVDHHLMSEGMPPAAAIINPNRPDDDSDLDHLAAAGVTFMLLVALNREAKRRGWEDTPDLLQFLGLTALGTICDVVKLQGLNRAFVAQGLKVLSTQVHDTAVLMPGVTALADIAGAKPPFTPYHAGFVLGPRINAGGRIGRSDMGASLLITNNTQLAYAHAAELDRVNTERKALQDRILEEALTAAQREDQADKSVIVVAMEDWHPGIIGIVAGRLKDRFNKPALVIGIDSEGIAKGSGRSIAGVNLGDAIVAAKEAGILSSGGGHAMAGGVTLKSNKINILRGFLNASLAEDVAHARANAALEIDAWVSASAVNLDLIASLDKAGPFGAGNPQPIIAIRDMQIAYAERVRGGHVRCAFQDSGGTRVSGICFRADETGLSDWLLDPQPPRVHIAGRVKHDTWKGRSRVDFQLSDMMLGD